MQLFKIPGRRVSHIRRTNCYTGDRRTTIIVGLCGIAYPTAYIKPVQENAPACQSCKRIAKPGVNC